MITRQKLTNILFKPTLIGLIINPFYIARSNLYKHIKRHALKFSGNLIDIGCGDKPYEYLFRNVTKYEGLEISSTVHTSTKAEFSYDGRTLPFNKETYESVFLSEVLEHVFNPDEFLKEINRVMTPNGKLFITVPFIWDEHEQPYDFARYSSFGIHHLLKKNGFEIELSEKSCSNIGVLFQLLNGYLYKITYSWNIVFRSTIFLLLCFPINLIGLISGFILPNNNDLYLDNIIIATKRNT